MNYGVNRLKRRLCRVTSKVKNTNHILCIYVTRRRWLVPTATPIMARDTQHTQTETMLRFRLHRKLLSYCYYSSTNCISCCQFPWSNFIMSPMHCQDNISIGHPRPLQSTTRRWPSRTRRRASVTQVSRPGDVSRGTQHVALWWVLSRDWRSTFGSAVYLPPNCIKLYPLNVIKLNS